MLCRKKQRTSWEKLHDVWFKIVGADCSTQADRVQLSDAATISDFRAAAKDKFSDFFQGIDADCLVVYEDMEAYDARQEVSNPLASIGRLGVTEERLMVLQVPQRRSVASLYLIQPAVQTKVEAVVFQIEDEDGVNVGMGVFYSPTRAATCARNLTSTHGTEGNTVTIVCGEERVAVKVKLRNEGMDFAVLESSSPRPFIPIWDGNRSELRGKALVLASYGLGNDKYPGLFEDELAFAAASCTEVSRSKTHVTYSCPALNGKSGAALVLANGEDVQLVGIHQKSINVVARAALLLQNLTHSAGRDLYFGS